MWDNKVYIEAFYNSLKENIKDKITRIEERPDKLAKIIKKVIQIDNQL